MRRAFLWAWFALAPACCQPAFAGPPTACPAGGMTAPGSCLCTVGTAGTDICVAARGGPQWRLVTIADLDATNAISVTDDGATPAIGSSWDIPAGFTRTWSATNVTFSGPFTAIAAAAGTKVMIKAQ